MTETFKNPQYYIENYKNNQVTFFSLLQRVQDSFVLFKQNPNDENIERNYRGYVDKVKTFHQKEMELDAEFQTSNINVNKGLDNMIRTLISKKNKIKN